MDEKRWLDHRINIWESELSFFQVLAAILLWILAIICIFITAGLELETPWNVDMNLRDSISWLSLHFTTLHFTLLHTISDFDRTWCLFEVRKCNSQSWHWYDLQMCCLSFVYWPFSWRQRCGSEGMQSFLWSRALAMCERNVNPKIWDHERDFIWSAKSCNKRWSCLIADESIDFSEIFIFSYSKPISWFGFSKPRFRLCGGGSWSCMWRKSWGTFAFNRDAEHSEHNEHSESEAVSVSVQFLACRAVFFVAPTWEALNGTRMQGLLQELQKRFWLFWSRAGVSVLKMWKDAERNP